MRRSLFLVVSLWGCIACRGRASDSSANTAIQKRTDDLLREQAALKARIAGLEQTAAALQAASRAGLSARQHAAADERPAGSLVAATDGESDNPATTPSPRFGESLPALQPAARVPGIAIEDLAGQPPTASASSPQGTDVPDEQTRALLDQLNTLGEQFKLRQADKKTALEVLEGLR